MDGRTLRLTVAAAPPPRRYLRDPWTGALFVTQEDSPSPPTLERILTLGPNVDTQAISAHLEDDVLTGGWGQPWFSLRAAPGCLCLPACLPAWHAARLVTPHATGACAAASSGLPPCLPSPPRLDSGSFFSALAFLPPRLTMAPPPPRHPRCSPPALPPPPAGSRHPALRHRGGHLPRRHPPAGRHPCC